MKTGIVRAMFVATLLMTALAATESRDDREPVASTGVPVSINADAEPPGYTVIADGYPKTDEVTGRFILLLHCWTEDAEYGTEFWISFPPEVDNLWLIPLLPVPDWFPFGEPPAPYEPEHGPPAPRDLWRWLQQGCWKNASELCCGGPDWCDQLCWVCAEIELDGNGEPVLVSCSSFCRAWWQECDGVVWYGGGMYPLYEIIRPCGNRGIGSDG